MLAVVTPLTAVDEREPPEMVAVLMVPAATLPLISTVKRLVLAALFWAWIRKPAGEVSVFRLIYKPYEDDRLPFSVNWMPVVVVLPLAVTVARVSASAVRQVVQVKVKLPPKLTVPPPPRGPEVFTVILELARSALATVPSAISAVVTPPVLIDTAPDETEKLPDENDAMPLAAVVALSIVTADPDPEELLIVKAPVNPSTEVTPPAPVPQADPVPEIMPALSACRHCVPAPARDETVSPVRVPTLVILENAPDDKSAFAMVPSRIFAEVTALLAIVVA